MATVNLDIVVKADGTRTVVRDLDAIGTAAERSGGKVSGLQEAFDRTAARTRPLQSEVSRLTTTTAQLAEASSGVGDAVGAQGAALARQETGLRSVGEAAQGMVADYSAVDAANDEIADSTGAAVRALRESAPALETAGEAGTAAAEGLGGIAAAAAGVEGAGDKVAEGLGNVATAAVDLDGARQAADALSGEVETAGSALEAAAENADTAGSALAAVNQTAQGAGDSLRGLAETSLDGLQAQVEGVQTAVGQTAATAAGAGSGPPPGPVPPEPPMPPDEALAYMANARDLGEVVDLTTRTAEELRKLGGAANDAQATGLDVFAQALVAIQNSEGTAAEKTETLRAALVELGDAGIKAGSEGGLGLARQSKEWIEGIDARVERQTAGEAEPAWFEPGSTAAAGLEGGLKGSAQQASLFASDMGTAADQIDLFATNVEKSTGQVELFSRASLQSAESLGVEEEAAKRAEEAQKGIAEAHKTATEATEKESKGHGNAMDTLMGYRREIVQGNRAVNFFARALNDIVPASSAAGEGLRLFAGAALGGIGIGLAIEAALVAMKAFGEWMKKQNEEQLRAIDTAGKHRTALIDLKQSVQDLIDAGMTEGKAGGWLQGQFKAATNEENRLEARLDTLRTKMALLDTGTLWRGQEFKEAEKEFKDVEGSLDALRKKRRETMGEFKERVLPEMQRQEARGMEREVERRGVLVQPEVAGSWGRSFEETKRFELLERQESNQIRIDAARRQIAEAAKASPVTAGLSTDEAIAIFEQNRRNREAQEAEKRGGPRYTGPMTYSGAWVNRIETSLDTIEAMTADTKAAGEAMSRLPQAAAPLFVSQGVPMAYRASEEAAASRRRTELELDIAGRRPGQGLSEYEAIARRAEFQKREIDVAIEKQIRESGITGAQRTVVESGAAARKEDIDAQARAERARLRERGGSAAGSVAEFEPERVAALRLRDARTELTKAVKEDAISADEAARMEEGLTFKMRNELEPLGALKRGFEEQASVRAAVGREREIEARFIADEISLHEKYGTKLRDDTGALNDLGRARRAEIAAQVDETRVSQLADSMFRNSAKARLESYKDEIAALEKIAPLLTTAEEGIRRREIERKYDPVAELSQRVEVQARLLGYVGDEYEIQQQLASEEERRNALGESLYRTQDDGTKTLTAQGVQIRQHLTDLQAINKLTQAQNRLYAGTSKAREAEAGVDVQAADNLVAQGKMTPQEGYYAKVTARTSRGVGDFSDGFVAQLGIIEAASTSTAQRVGEAWGQTFSGLIDGFAQASAHALIFDEKLEDGMKRVVQGVMEQLLSQLISIGVRLLINAGLQAVFGEAAAGTTAQTTAAAAAGGPVVAAAWAPAATMVSLATFGGNSVPAIAGIMATLAAASAGAVGASLATGAGTAAAVGSSGKAYSEGGYTGDMGRNEVAGVVHGQEFVVNAAATRKNRGLLEVMNVTDRDMTGSAGLLGARGGGSGGRFAGAEALPVPRFSAVAWSAVPGFAAGGYTGSGPIDEVAGVVHGGEYVINADATGRNRATLDALNSGAQVAAGPRGGDMNLTVNVENTMSDRAEVQIDRSAEDELRIRVIARQEIHSHAPRAVAADLSNPNGLTSKALTRNTDAQRRR